MFIWVPRDFCTLLDDLITETNTSFDATRIEKIIFALIKRNLNQHLNKPKFQEKEEEEREGKRGQKQKKENEKRKKKEKKQMKKEITIEKN